MSVKMFICKICGELFNWYSEVEEHLREKHGIRNLHKIIDNYEIIQKKEKIDEERKLGDG